MKLCRFLEIKKNLPSNKEDMLESFNIDRVIQSDYYTNLQVNLGFCCSGKQICPVPTNYKQISMSTNYKQISISVLQENRFTHKLQANYNIIKKQKTKTHKMQRWSWNGVRILIIKESSLFLSAHVVWLK